MLTKFIARQKPVMANMVRHFAAGQEYDVAVIGGGPGGKSIQRDSCILKATWLPSKQDKWV